MSIDDDENWKKKMESRVAGIEKMGTLLKDEVSGLRTSISSLLAADREKTNALEGHHQAYAAANLRAEYNENRATKAEKRSEALEAELQTLRANKDGA